MAEQIDTGADTDERGAYNEAAITVAERLTAARSAQRKKLRQDRALEDRFPPFNRAGLGVALEYERMGNQPVSDELLERAESSLGVRLEHLGITLGTVVHGIDLKRELSAETVRFLRDVLLERKVIFFRDQNLTEDEQVAFGRCFGELDAFPFGAERRKPIHPQHQS